MGPVLTCRRRGPLLAALLLPLAGCWPLAFTKQPACVPVQRTEALPAPYSQYFGSLVSCNAAVPGPVSASSSTGLSDSYSYGCLAVDEAYAPETSSECEVVRYAQRRAHDFASLYGYSFITQVEQSTDGPQLRLRDLSPSGVTASLELTYRFTGRQTSLSYYSATAGGTTTYATAPVVTELRNFPNGTRTYAQVWRLTNPLNAAQGRATAVVAYYVDRDYGLIRFDQRDGTSWTLAR